MAKAETTVDVDTRIDALVAKGDEAVVRMMFDRYAPTLRRLLRRARGAGFSEEDVDDVVQEAMTYLWNRRLDFDRRKGTVRGLLFRKARQLRDDRIRKAQRRNDAHPRNGIPDSATALDGHIRSPSEQAMECEAVRDARTLLPRLSDLEREALLASARNPTRYAEDVANRRRITPGNVRVAANRARRKMQKWLLERGHTVE